MHGVIVFLNATLLTSDT